MNQPSPIAALLRGLVGAVLGGLAGYWICRGMLTYGLYAIMVPGAMLGVGWGVLARRNSIVGGVLAAAAAVALGIFTEWNLFPFVADGSLGFFLKHLADLGTVKLILIGLGAAFAFWCAAYSGPPGRRSAAPGDERKP